MGVAVYKRELSMVLYDDLEGYDGWEVEGRLKRERIYVEIQLICTVVQQKLTQHCKASILHSKIKHKKNDPVQVSLSFTSQTRMCLFFL